jgi:sporulation protein YlmC with PRC-barrel domain
MASINNPTETHGRLIAASKVNGTNVYNRAGEKLGSIYDVMRDRREVSSPALERTLLQPRA